MLIYIGINAHVTDAGRTTTSEDRATQLLIWNAEFRNISSNARITLNETLKQKLFMEIWGENRIGYVRPLPLHCCENKSKIIASATFVWLAGRNGEKGRGVIRKYFE